MRALLFDPAVGAGRPVLWVVLAAVVIAGCGSGGGPVPAADPEPSAAPVLEPVAPAPDGPGQREIDALSGQLAEERQAVVAGESENEALRAELDAKQTDLTSLEERYAALEIELSQTLEEVLRAKASVRGVHSRALATSRISEVRVQLDSVPRSGDAEVAGRMERAEGFLERADRELEQDNYGGASYLADRASDLVLQARAVREVRRSVSAETGPITPIVPPRPLTVLANSNLREGPGIDRARVGGVEVGDRVLAVARSGEWFRVETDSGLTAWILGRLVE